MAAVRLTGLTAREVDSLDAVLERVGEDTSQATASTRVYSVTAEAFTRAIELNLVTWPGLARALRSAVSKLEELP